MRKKQILIGVGLAILLLFNLPFVFGTTNFFNALARLFHISRITNMSPDTQAWLETFLPEKVETGMDIFAHCTNPQKAYGSNVDYIYDFNQRAIYLPECQKIKEVVLHTSPSPVINLSYETIIGQSVTLVYPLNGAARAIFLYDNIRDIYYQFIRNDPRPAYVWYSIAKGHTSTFFDWLSRIYGTPSISRTG